MIESLLSLAAILVLAGVFATTWVSVRLFLHARRHARAPLFAALVATLLAGIGLHIGLLQALFAALESVQWAYRGRSVSLWQVLQSLTTGALILVGALWAARTLEALAARHLPPHAARLANYVGRVLLLFCASVLAFAAIGIDATAVSVIGGATVAGIAFGLRQLASNYTSGYVILAERPVSIGDVVRIGTTEGRVGDIGSRYTTVQTAGRHVLIPNDVVATTIVENLTFTDPSLMLSTTFRLEPSVNVETLRDGLLKEVVQVPRVLTEPAPSLVMGAIEEGLLVVTLNFWVGDPENSQGKVRSDVNLAILRCLSQQGVEIARPHRVLHRTTP
ncbi:Mechanosensitive channel MscK [Gammaproteobacteria bacterium]|nr:Mechanosensitive channel MscK [Gammaproteobacteria bacterium]